jgi:hypothetical protein
VTTIITEDIRKNIVSNLQKQVREVFEALSSIDNLVITVFPNLTMDYINRPKFRTEEDKHELVDFFKLRIKRAKAVALVHAFECWTLGQKIKDGQTNEDAAKEAYKYGRISKHPDRVEAVSFMYFDKEKEIGSMARIKTLGTIKTLESWSEPMELVGGTLTGYFKPNHTS